MLLDRFSLTDKVAIVTGAGRGIGAACALGFAEAGADVVIAARTKEQLEEVAYRVADHGRRALGVPCDVSETANLELVVEQAMGEFGRIDVVVNNAGGSMPGPFLDTSEKAFEGAFHFNVTTAFTLSKLAVPLFLGRLIAEKERQEQIVRDSGLDWIIVRPARFVDRPPRGVYRSGPRISMRIVAGISRADVAEFVLKQVSDDTYLRQAVSVSY